MPSATVEDYIKHIYLVSEKLTSCEVPMGQVAEALGVVPGTATTMVKALADAGLVQYAPRVGVRLTEPGRKLALHVLRRHRLIEQFLVEVLGFDWSEVHEEAEQMEHVVSDLLLERIDRYLGHPTEDPHGDPIPSAEGELLGGALETLLDCPLEAPLWVARISDQDPDFLNYIAESGLNPGVQLQVCARSLRAESVQIILTGSGESLTLGMGAAAKVQVRLSR
ncbi:metal-dependent transcriptional regulator [Coraliomargarita sp. SDUM461004]|uniref:Transcriptional regulator MntR n=1 Tax=Thalassobacterium sedimentorum TaxID=3041258 RepID=A0ABU1AE91_9BACT|nr:metal-dependent transcriptional regulator [Coraliomargarita sp. SDUM461004]MDQ8193082.1 metal-dependent transcriptional regulator [Coraliomargarita sp. SDUM461004]